MLKNIEIKGLFGRFNYKLDFEGKEIVILTGPNGFGKSTILRIVEAIANNSVFYLLKIEFKEIKFCFESENEDIFFTLTKKNGKLYIDNMLIKMSKRWSDINRIINNIVDSYPKEKEIKDEKYSDFFNLFLKHIIVNGSLKDKKRGKVIKNDFKNQLKNLRNNIGEVRLVSEQRLLKKQNLSEKNEEIVDVVLHLSEEFQKEISKVSERYSNIANELDSTYPQRLFNAKEEIKNENEFRQYMEISKTKFDKLREYDLAEMPSIGESQYNSKYGTALKIYFDDFSKKYEVFEALIKKFDLFTRIINSRFNFKKVKISKSHGLEIIDQSDSNKKIDLQQLSSGEKQEIILFYNLIFKTKDNLLLLIDEPEISLHIVWQKKFLEDLLKITENSKIKVILATHSPQIISNHWDLQIDLGEQYQSDKLNSK